MHSASWLLARGGRAKSPEQSDTLSKRGHQNARAGGAQRLSVFSLSLSPPKVRNKKNMEKRRKQRLTLYKEAHELQELL